MVFGKASGFAANINLSSLDGSNGFKLNGVAAYDQSGHSVASAGDINGDGFADLIVGAPNADPNGGGSGTSYVVFGVAPDSAVDRIGSAADQTIPAERSTTPCPASVETTACSGNGGTDTLVGGDGNDVLRGGAGNDDMAAAPATISITSTAAWTWSWSSPARAPTRFTPRCRSRSASMSSA